MISLRVINLTAMAKERAKFSLGRLRQGAILINDEGEFYEGSYIHGICPEKVAIIGAIIDTHTLLTIRILALTHFPCHECCVFISKWATVDSLIIIDGIGDFCIEDLLQESHRLAGRGK